MNNKETALDLLLDVLCTSYYDFGAAPKGMPNQQFDKLAARAETLRQQFLQFVKDNYHENSN